MPRPGALGDDPSSPSSPKPPRRGTLSTARRCEIWKDHLGALALKVPPLKERSACVAKMRRRARRAPWAPRRDASHVKALTDVLRATLTFSTIDDVRAALETLLDESAQKRAARKGATARVVGAREKLLDSSCSGFRSATVMLRLGDDDDTARGSVVGELRLTTDRLHATAARYHEEYRRPRRSLPPFHRFRGLSASRPRSRPAAAGRPPRTIRVAAAAPPRPVSCGYPRHLSRSPRRYRALRLDARPFRACAALDRDQDALSAPALLEELRRSLKARRPGVGDVAATAAETFKVAEARDDGFLVDDEGILREAGEVIAIHGAPVAELPVGGIKDFEGAWGTRGVALAVGEAVE